MNKIKNNNNMMNLLKIKIRCRKKKLIIKMKILNKKISRITNKMIIAITKKAIIRMLKMIKIWNKKNSLNPRKQIMMK